LAQGVNHSNAAELAYLGDAVFELFVREMLINEGIPFRAINRRAKTYVSAHAQAAMYHRIFPVLSPEEQHIMKRGRNLHSLSRAKNAGVSEYRHATGLEALFGHLHKNGEITRLKEIFFMCICELPEKFLQPCEIIDFDTSLEIQALSEKIAAASQNEIEFVKNAYEFVRDEISHTADIGGEIVTCKASEVLREKQGVCYAKSHLLAAVLRHKKIPAGLCYQRLILDDSDFPYLTLHGLNVVFIEKKWIRLDARGNKTNVNAQFSLEREQLAFSVRPEKGEEDISGIFAVPDANVVNALTQNKTAESLWRNLPANLRSLPSND
jgi:23S rRNA maturation mini-RNase III